MGITGLQVLSRIKNGKLRLVIMVPRGIFPSQMGQLGSPGLFSLINGDNKVKLAIKATEIA